MKNRSSIFAAVALAAMFSMPATSHAGGAHLHQMLEAKHQMLRSFLEAKRNCIMSLFHHHHHAAAPAKAAPAKAAPKKAAAKPMK
jgi:hypothetical protein